MSSFTDTQISPKQLRSFPSVTELNQNADIADFFDLLSWFRGDVRLGNLFGTSGTNITAGQTLSTQIAPPNIDEEWEIIAIQVEDRAHIDVLDNVEFTFVDLVAGLSVDLQSTQLAGHARSSSFMTIFPSRGGAIANGPNNCVNGISGLVLRNRDNVTQWQRMTITYAATATVGTRSIFVIYVYRRRPVS